MMYVIGDVHLRSEEPFFSVTKEFLNDVVSMVSDGDAVVFTGDFFHRSRPYSEELKVAGTFCEKMKDKHVHVGILAGNHEYFRDRDTWAEDVFADYDVDFIEWPCLSLYYGVQIMFMPWMPLRHIVQYSSAKNIKEYYETLFNKYFDKVGKDRPLYLIYHFEDETVFGGPEVGVDLSCFEKKFGKLVRRVGGHIHNPDSNYLGAPYATRKDETAFNRYILKIDPNTDDDENIPVKQKIEFKTLSYEELKTERFDEEIRYVVKVLDTPSLEATKLIIDSKNNVWLDDYELKFNEERDVDKDKSDELFSIKEFLDMYIKHNKVDPNTANYLLSLF